MTTRHVLARIAALVTAAAGHRDVPEGGQRRGGRPPLDGSANHDPDMGTDGLGSAMAQEFGSRVDGWAPQQQPPLRSAAATPTIWTVTAAYGRRFARA